MINIFDICQNRYNNNFCNQDCKEGMRVSNYSKQQ